MSEQSLAASLFFQRKDTERRKRASFAPPYLSGEGMVLVDRREGGERRAQYNPINGADSARGAALKPVAIDARMEQDRQVSKE